MDTCINSDFVRDYQWKGERSKMEEEASVMIHAHCINSNFAHHINIDSAHYINIDSALFANSCNGDTFDNDFWW